MIDYCILGSGISGSTIANILSKNVLKTINFLRKKKIVKNSEILVSIDNSIEFVYLYLASILGLVTPHGNKKRNLPSRNNRIWASRA